MSPTPSSHRVCFFGFTVNSISVSYDRKSCLEIYFTEIFDVRKVLKANNSKTGLFSIRGTYWNILCQYMLRRLAFVVRKVDRLCS